ncbi:MAG: DNA primase [Bacteroidia bacterium]
MARIPQHIVDQIYNAMDIVDIVSDYMPLKKRGANYWARSPFSNEKTPSFAVNPVKGIYKDFSSGKGGNAINFLMEMEGYEYVDALKHVARKYNIEIEEEEETPEAKVERDRQQSLFVVNEFAARYFHEQLTQNPKGIQIGHSYFKERGILDATIEEFQLGYCLDEWDAFSKTAAEKMYQEDYLTELGLASRSEKTGNLIDRFRGRVIFPITSPVGKVLGFGGRILGKAQDIAKYINSPESEIYHKGQVLYGLFQAKKAIRDLDQCILTEGYMDTIVLHQNGIKNVVASSGTALTPDQIRLIRRFTKNVLMIYDGDAAGVKAALRGIDLLLKEGMNVRVLILPDNHDPDSYVITFGAKAFTDFAEKEALSFLDFKIRVLSEGKPKNDPRHQAELIKSLAETVGHIPDMVERQMYIKHVAQQVDITEALMTHAVDEARRENSKLERKEKKGNLKRVESPYHFLSVSSIEGMVNPLKKKYNVEESELKMDLDFLARLKSELIDAELQTLINSLSEVIGLSEEGKAIRKELGNKKNLYPTPSSKNEIDFSGNCNKLKLMVCLVILDLTEKIVIAPQIDYKNLQPERFVKIKKTLKNIETAQKCTKKTILKLYQEITSS